MQGQTQLTQKLGSVFNQKQAVVLAEVITDAYSELVKTSDFNELKSIVKELATAQQRTEQRVEELATAQQRTEQRIEELAVAQKETQHELKILAQRMSETNSTLGGLGRSVAYALENEAYRMLPAFLAEEYGIEMTERLVRTEVGGEEINLLGRGRRNGQDILVVGETKLRLDERRKGRRKREGAFEQLAIKVAAVQESYPDMKIVPIIITHYARPRALKRAQDEGIIVVQSFEW